MKKIFGVLFIILGLGLTLVFNGNVLSSKLGIPPLGKLFNPFHGAWAGSDTSREIKLSGQDGDIEILIDKRGVPHIYAQTIEDALYGQGYIEARDRTFQMQFIRQVASGQLSEYFGERTLDYDKRTHRKGIPASINIAAKAYAQDADVAATHQPYIDGANLFLSKMNYGDYPYEMKLLNLKPKLWNIASATAVFKYIGNILAGGNYDMENTNVRVLLGEERYNKYYNETDDGQEPVIPLEVSYGFEVVNKDVKPDALFDKPVYKAFFEKRNKNIGSNNWTVGGSKTTSGYPILSSDPHLSLSLPSIWYEVNIITPDIDVYGVSFPGLPGIMIGFNQYIYWAETNVGQDVQDLYHIKYTDENRSHYWLDGKKVPVEYRYDTIQVKGQGIVIDTNWITHWGPIIKKSNDGKTDIAMDWLVAHPAPASETNVFVNSMQSKSYTEFLEASGVFITPAQNFLYADKSGTIGLRVNGLLPARVEDDGRFISEGDSTKYGWNHWIPRDQNPQSINPKQGYLTSSNQRSAGPDYPYYYTGRFEHYRNRAINDYLDTVSNVNIDMMKALQNDNLSKLASDFLPMFLDELGSSSLSPEAEKVKSTMEGWNYRYEVDDIAPSMFEKWYREVRRLTWDEITVYKDTMSVLYPNSTVLRDLIRDEPSDPIFDRIYTIPKETATEVIQLGFDSLTAYVSRHDDEYLKWGNRNKVNLPHVARIPGLGVDKLYAPGCGDAINATRGNFGPSWRMVVGLGEQVEAYGVYPGGQSGDPRSDQYMNMVEKWRTGNYDKLIYGVSKSEILSE